MPTNEELKILQALPLDIKIEKTRQRIREWVNHYGVEDVYLSFSGGKDSTVLLDIVREEYPGIEAVFVNTGLEFPEIQKFVREFGNVTILRPEMRFDQIIMKYGYPLIGKEVAECVSQAKKSAVTGKYNYRIKRLRGELLNENGQKSIYNLEKWHPLLSVDFNISNKCCHYLKKRPIEKYGKHKAAFIATTAEESRLRRQQWLRHGCNAFDKVPPRSNPMSIWKEQDILQYIKAKNLEIASVYGNIVQDDDKLRCTGCHRTGCVYCGFGAHLDKGESRYERLKKTHPQLYEYCLEGGEYAEDGLWKPNRNGLGMRHVFDELNKIYGGDFIRY